MHNEPLHLNLDGSVYCVDVQFFMPALPGKWFESLVVRSVVCHTEHKDVPIGEGNQLYRQVLACTSYELNLLEPLTPEEILEINEESA